MTARLHRLLLLMAVAAFLFSANPGFAFDLTAPPSREDTASALSSLIGAQSPNRLLSLLDKVSISPFLAIRSVNAPSQAIAGEDNSLQPSAYTKISAGISIGLADEASAVIVKRIALRGIGRQQTWPRRPPTAFEVPTDHIFEAGLRFQF
jgi:hypothetical protein